MHTLKRLFANPAPVTPSVQKPLCEEVSDLLQDLSEKRVAPLRISEALSRVAIAALAEPRQFAQSYDRLCMSLEPDFWEDPHVELTLPFPDSHKEMVRAFVVKWMDRRLHILDEQIKGSTDTVDRNAYLRIARMLAEMSPVPQQAARARPMAATLRALLMPEAVCITKGHKPVDKTFPPALKQTYVVDVADDAQKLLREVTFGGEDGTPSRTYLMEKTVMRGTFGKVHMALKPNGERCVIKVERLRSKEGATKKVTIDEVLEQNEILNKVGSPLVPLERAVVDDKLYTVLAYYGAGDLFTCVQRFKNRGQRIPGVLLAHLFRFGGAFLQKMRDAGVRHRDIKPGNILFDAVKGVAIGDFGFAHDGTSEEWNMAEGTHGYMAPETLTTSVDAPEGDANADIFSLALTFIYLCVTRARDIPFYVSHDEKSSEETMEKAIEEFNAWRKARSPTGSEHGPLDWDLIEKGKSPMDKAARDFVAYAPEIKDIAKYMVESGLVVSPEHRTPDDDLATKGIELYPATDEQESDVRALLQWLTELNSAEEAAFHALESHFKARQEATAEKATQENGAGIATAVATAA